MSKKEIRKTAKKIWSKLDKLTIDFDDLAQELRDELMDYNGKDEDFREEVGSAADELETIAGSVTDAMEALRGLEKY